jgi:hypothetical protein
MSKPFIHAQSSARKFGGRPEDYLDIHNMMDSSKAIIADNRHRIFTHNAWFISTIIERIFGVAIQNSDGKQIATRDIAEQHVLEDFGGKFIPTGQDYVQELQLKNWMNGNGFPSSRLNIEEQAVSTFIPFDND